ncbi:MAG TPA: DUF1761 domain-containing protein [Terracidiphilus sp.]|jgi:hypothetical protein|nr:DUF1761 domain-containing protein [Terracidiphilus sp.]
MHHIHHAFNPWAIFVSALFLWFLGAFWYSPLLFAKPWVAIVGRQMGEKPKGVYKGMIGSFIGDLLLSFVLAHLILWSGAATIQWGAMIGFIAWAGFFIAPNYPQSIYEGRPFTYVLINNGYWLVGLLVSGALLAVWR